jgi:hypothetical protein
MTSVALSGGPIHLGLDTSKNAILVGILRPDEMSPDTEKIFNDEASIRRLIDRFEDRGRLRVCYEAGPTGFGLYVVADPQRRDRVPRGSAISTSWLSRWVSIPMTASTISATMGIRPRAPSRVRADRSAPAWVESPRGTSVTGHANGGQASDQANTVGQAGVGGSSDRSGEGHAYTRPDP